MLRPHLLQTQRRTSPLHQGSHHQLWRIISATSPSSPSRFKRPSNLGHILLSIATILKSPQLFAAAPRHLFPPSVTPPPIVKHRPEPPVAPLKLEDVQHAGRMRKRKTTKLLRHEWQDHHFTLRGARLAMHRDETATSKTLEVIDVDDFAIACSSL